jgi:putative transposase
MIKRRFKKSEIQKVLQEYKNGMTIQNIIKEYSISQATFYNWKAKYSSLSSNDSLNLIRLKEENDRLKRMYADLSLENLMLKWQLEKRE